MNEELKQAIASFLEVCDEVETCLTSRLPDALRDIVKFDMLLFLLDIIPIDSDLSKEHYNIIINILDFDYTYEEVDSFYNSDVLLNASKKEKSLLGVNVFFELSKIKDECWDLLNLLIHLYFLIGYQYLMEGKFVKLESINQNSNYICFVKKIECLVNSLKVEENIETRNKLDEIIASIKNSLHMKGMDDSSNIAEEENSKFEVSENRMKIMEDILEKIEYKSEETEISTYDYKIKAKDYFNVLNEFELDEEELEYINDQLDESNIVIVNEFNQEFEKYKEVINFLKKDINSFPTIYIDDFKMISTEFELNEKQKEELYAYLKVNYTFNEYSRCIAELMKKMINVENKLFLVSKEDYEAIKNKCDCISLEDLEDYTESNNVKIFSKAFLDLLDLIELTTSILDNKISYEMLDDYMFEFDLTIIQWDCLNDWIELKEIDVFEDPCFPYDITRKENFLYEMYNKMENSLTILNDFQVQSIYRQAQKGDLYFLEKLRIAGFRILLAITKRYSDGANFLYMLREGHVILDNAIEMYCSKEIMSFYEFVEVELEKGLKNI